ncbi:hypothetical protein OEV98_08425 [Caldibacillus lycopersici]|uniref:YkoP-like domain-containing protein n=1 Tax=Perspicuibacillus lycopersici TaxID=1325689 RepID=A0AAE3IS23_9BACI|nr:hypothetical protein [Perspicuibacillus lycopersici]MCU9613583.1 hypothetical protein [Perspicuibacillus lycopersici]
MRNLILLCWRLIDPFYYFFSRLTYIKNGENIFRVRLTKYKGYNVTLADGTTIHKNDLLIKIHLHNVKLLSELLSIQDDFQKGKLFYHSIKKSLPELANYVQNHPKKEQIKGIIGITSLKFGNNRLGFETHAIQNSVYRKMKWLAFLPINLLSLSILQHNQKKTSEPAYIFISKDILLTKHLQQHMQQEAISFDRKVMTSH